MNATVNAFIESKKLRLSYDKCSAIHVGKKKGECPDLKVHMKPMHREEQTKYLGDIFHSSGKSKPNVIERIARAYAILSEIQAILSEVPLGIYRTEVGLQLRQAMFVNGVLYNSETWQGLNSTDITSLSIVDHKIMRVICNGHAKTPTEFYYLETGALPLENIVASRRIMYHHNIISRDKNELVRRVYEAQKGDPTKGDFIELVKKDMESIGEVFNEDMIGMENKEKYKAKIQKKLKTAVFKELKAKQLTHTKINEIKYSQMKIQPYMTNTSFTNNMVKVLFNMRSSMTRNFKGNFSSMFKDNMRCQLMCQETNAIDCQSHLLQCQFLLDRLTPEELERTKEVTYRDIYGSLEQQRKVVVVLSRMLEIREEELEKESLPVGGHTGPADIISF